MITQDSEPNNQFATSLGSITSTELTTNQTQWRMHYLHSFPSTLGNLTGNDLRLDGTRQSNAFAQGLNGMSSDAR